MKNLITAFLLAAFIVFPVLRAADAVAADVARDLAQALPSQDSRDYGQPFAEIFKRFKGDFYAIDPMLFSPAEVIVTALDSGESFHKGHVDLKLLDASFT